MNSSALSFAALLGSILLLTLGGGGIFPATVCIAAVLTCAAWGLFLARQTPGFGDDGASRNPTLALALSLTAILLFVLLTALPLPGIFDPFIGAARREQNRTAETALRLLSQWNVVDAQSPWFCLSRNRAGTLRMVLLLAAAFGALMAGATLAARTKMAYLHFLSFAGAVIAAGGHVSQWWIPQGDTLWWTIPIPHVLPGPVGCFVNRNHFAGFVAMLAPVAFVLADRCLRQRKFLFSVLHLAAGGAMLCALFASGSRGAVLAFLAACLVLIGAIALRRRLLTALIYLSAVAGIAVAAVMLSPAIRARLEGLHDPLKIPSAQNRLMEWRESLRVWPSYPVLGAGGNALRMVYPQFRQTSRGRWLVFSENEYIQLLVEGGIAGTALAGALLYALYRRIRPALPSTPAAIRLGATGALLVAALHCMVDFPLHLPLYTLTLASVVGLLLPPPAAGITPRQRTLCLAPAVLGLAAAAGIAVAGADRLRKADTYEELQNASLPELRSALVSAPTSWHAWYLLGYAACAEGVQQKKVRLCFVGEQFMTQATRYDPQNYRLWHQLGRTRDALLDDYGADEAYARANQLRSWVKPPPRKRRP
jgi:hypothetical protein